VNKAETQYLEQQ